MQSQADQNKTVKCIIITGAHTKAFVAGADIKEFAHLMKKKALTLQKTCKHVV